MTYEQQQITLLLFGFLLGCYHSIKVTGTILSAPLLSPIYMLLITFAYNHIIGH
jgi:hypothetical protein